MDLNKIIAKPKENKDFLLSLVDTEDVKNIKDKERHFSKHIILSNLDDKNIDIMLLDYDILELWEYNAMPHYGVSFEDISENQKQKILFRAVSRRAYKGFEREMMAKNIIISKQEQEIKQDIQQTTPSKGLFSFFKK